VKLYYIFVNFNSFFSILNYKQIDQMYCLYRIVAVLLTFLLAIQLQVLKYNHSLHAYLIICSQGRSLDGSNVYKPNSRGSLGACSPENWLTLECQEVWFGVYLIQIRMFHRLYNYVITFYLDLSLVT